jgi:FkbH-like protein
MVKCVVWDLDGTLWQGILLEGDDVAVKQEAVETILNLDRRGILQSVASRNDFDTAMAKLKAFGLAEYFLYPQINWNAKSSSIKTISQLTNIRLEAMAFVDDQVFERDEVRHTFPEVRCFDAERVERLLQLPEMTPRFITADSQMRRKMYLCDVVRNEAETKFCGAHEEFLASLNMCLTIRPAETEDLQRAEELTVRTHQLNTTGYTYSYDELEQFLQSKNHQLLICTLEDRYGTYGTIGLTLIEHREAEHVLKLFLMSCRVMSRGIGSIVLNHLMMRAKTAEARFVAEFVANKHNRAMFITFKLAGFREIGREENKALLQADPGCVQAPPNYVRIDSSDDKHC